MNPPQQQAVRQVEGPLLVLAGAGSGKTRVITEKIAHLLRSSALEPEQVFAVTFTNRAAREMSERVVQTVGRAGSRVSISTFHRLGLRILRENPTAAGLRSGFSIFDAGDADSLIKELLRIHFGGDADAKALRELGRAAMNAISAWKNDLCPPETALETAGTGVERTQAAVYADYVNHLAASNAVDFDDLILRPVEILRDSPQWRATWQARVRYLLVDEYQDTNGCQYELIRLLTGERGAFTVVGDDDQSIYAWRGARPDNLITLARDFPALEVVKLEQNYRSRSSILRSANALIGHNPHLFEKRLWSERGPGDPVRIVQVADDEAEADRIAGEILQMQTRLRADWGDFAVIYRSNYQVRQLELRLQALKIPYRVSGGGSFFDRGEIRDSLAYFRLLVNPDDDGALLRVINVPRRQIGAATLSALQRIAGRRRCALLRAMDDATLAAEAGGSAARRLTGFAGWLAGMRNRLRQPGRSPAEVLRDLLDEVDYRGWLERHSGEPERARVRWANIELLLRAIGRRSAEGDAPEEVLRSLVLDDMQDDEDEPGPHQVQLLTLHASKGLEFPNVWIMGMEEGLLPHRNCTTEEQIHEERRLAYVGITRAQERLTLTHTRKRRSRGESLASEPSRFLDELPAELVVREGGDDEPEERKEERARDSLATLRAMFD
ncbi:MAG: UvrD-helicase domain-containing protein [Gammaproteobacteria bacterium]|nr:UvrD-helicase domain-containing protein [Gammaproteobacteria bacterium]